MAGQVVCTAEEGRDEPQLSPESSCNDGAGVPPPRWRSPPRKSGWGTPGGDPTCRGDDLWAQGVVLLSCLFQREQRTVVGTLWAVCTLGSRGTG